MSRIGVFFRGLLMGAADLVPGVSGGTIALISGIYYRLIKAIRCCDLIATKSLLSGDFTQFWNRIDGGFLFILVSGILVSIFSLARIVEVLLIDYPLPLWSCFFGLILASAFFLIHKIESLGIFRLFLIFMGLLLSGAITLMPRISIVGGWEIIFISGFVAIVAMILPGISGSFILVLLGMYPSLINAISTVDIFFLFFFSAGAIVGLIVFSRILTNLLAKANEATMSVMSGFLLGSLPAVWPWKKVAQTSSDESGALVSSQSLPVSPWDYSIFQGVSPQLEICISMMVLGFSTICILEAFGSKNRANG